MTDVSLLDHERDVEQARAKLAQDLTVLCSAKTFAAFKDDLKQGAFDTRDEFLENLKARAAANPAAVIAIAAGLAWRVIQHPPIASALIGVGLFSLWRAEPKTLSAGRPRSSYLEEAKESLKEQAGEALSGASDVAGRARETMSAKGAEVWEAAKDKMQKWGEEVSETVGDMRSSGVAADKVRDDDVRNKLLLGMAGAAVAAAVGIACQKRISETTKA